MDMYETFAFQEVCVCVCVCNFKSKNGVNVINSGRVYFPLEPQLSFPFSPRILIKMWRKLTKRILRLKETLLYRKNFPTIQVWTRLLSSGCQGLFP